MARTQSSDPAGADLRHQVEGSLQAALAYAEERQYEGYSKFDALNSPLAKAASLNRFWPRLIITQVVMRAPINLRPLLGVRKSKNPKGMGLFARAYLNLYRHYGEASYLDKATYCLEWLKDNSSPGYSGDCWGYNFDWQTPGFYAPAGMPNSVVTAFVTLAFLSAYEVTNESHFLQTARSTVNFLTKDLPVLFDSGTMKCVSYVPIENRLQVINVTALAAAVLAQVGHHTQEAFLLDEAQQLMRYVVDKQTEYGAWYYTDPPSDSPLRHDNYHTGFILDTLLDYMTYSGDRQFEHAYEVGLDFYVQNLFLPDGAPKFMSDKVYPLDIHGAAQGIITFSRSEKPEHTELAAKIAGWAIQNMQNPSDGHFYYQKTRFFTKRFSLMRWNQSWMCLGLSMLLARVAEVNAP